jgi:2-dehydro-3-deoxyphosphogluconate aldolase/(4S)-4-hydroxy-2-oxoglutarate aldolase
MTTPSMTLGFPPPLRDRIRRLRIIAVVVIDDADHAVPLARALLAGGISAIELTLRTPAAFEALHRIRGECPEMLAGLGTLIATGQVAQAVAAGAAFAVAPGLRRRRPAGRSRRASSRPRTSRLRWTSGVTC